MIAATIILALTIFSTYPDPLQAENGGEAVQLYNPGSTPSSTDGLVIATKTSTYTLPVATILPGAGYLIADTGWSTLRDNTSWPDADYETGLSLANTDGLVELRQTLTNGSYLVLDSLAWNSTLGRAREGYAWTHQREARPFFFNSSAQLVPFTITVEETLAPPTITNITLPDDAPQNGIQLMGYARTITVRAIITGDATVTARLAGRETELERVDNSTRYQGQLTLPAVSAGEYELVITATSATGDTTERVDVTVLPTATIAVETLTLRGAEGAQTTGVLALRNQGNAQRTVRLATLPSGITCAPNSLTLEPGMNATFNCAGVPGMVNGTGYALVTTS